MWLWWIFIAVLTVGLILLIIPLLTNSRIKAKTHSEAICQHCGKRWVVRD
jgi:hypothetical protein